MSSGTVSDFGPARGIQPPTEPIKTALPTHVVNGIILRCEECGAPYRPGTTWSRFCGDSCRLAAWSENHIRVHKADMTVAFGKDWQAKIASAKSARKQREAR